MAIREARPEGCEPGRAAASAGVDGYLARIADRGGELLVAEEAGRIVGSVLWHRDEGSASIKPDVRDHAMISGFVVAPDQRGKGVGQALMLEVERRVRARGFKRVVLGVVAWNGPTIALMRRPASRRSRRSW